VLLTLFAAFGDTVDGL
jgi:hypothetical protein